MRKTDKKKQDLRALLIIACTFCMAAFIVYMSGNTEAIGNLPENIAQAATGGAITPAPTTDLKIHYLNVNHGDSIVLEKNGKFMLIDAGPLYKYNQATESWTSTNIGYRARDYLKKLGATNLEAVIATHPHMDHIQGMNGVLKEIPTNLIFMPKLKAGQYEPKDHSFYKNLMNRLDKLKVTPTIPSVGDTYMFEDVKLTFLAPKKASYSDVNDYSIVVRATYGNTSILLTGDALKKSEQEMMDSGYTLKSTVLKVPHHSIAGTTQYATDHQAFIRTVKPKYSVITNNILCSNYVLSWLRETGDVWGTFDKKDIVMTSDGNKITFDSKPDYYATENVTVKTSKKSSLKMEAASATDDNKYNTAFKKTVTLTFAATSPTHTFAKTEYMLVKSGDKYKASNKWTTGKNVKIKKDFKGRVYVRFTRDDGSTVVYKTKGFAVEKTKPKSPKVKATGISGIKLYNTSKKTTYNKVSYKNVKLKFSIKWGTSGKKSISYKLVEKGKKFKKTGGWKNGTKVKIKKNFTGCVYVRYTSKAGYVIYKKTSGFRVIK